MPLTCMYIGCGNNDKLNEKLTFFPYPSDPQCLNEWIKYARPGPYNSFRRFFCSEHFHARDIIIQSTDEAPNKGPQQKHQTRLRLQPNAIPLPTNEHLFCSICKLYEFSLDLEASSSKYARNIIALHFNKVSNSISKMCNTCWETSWRFHELYEMVQLPSTLNVVEGAVTTTEETHLDADNDEVVLEEYLDIDVLQEDSDHGEEVDINDSLQIIKPIEFIDVELSYAVEHKKLLTRPGGEPTNDQANTTKPPIQTKPAKMKNQLPKKKIIIMNGATKLGSYIDDKISPTLSTLTAESPTTTTTSNAIFHPDNAIMATDSMEANAPPSERIAFVTQTNRQTIAPRGRATVVIAPTMRRQRVPHVKFDDELNRRALAVFPNLLCELCATHFDSIAEVRPHYVAEHKRPGYLRCCGAQVDASAVAILRHIQAHEKRQNLSCPFCGHEGRSPRLMELHLDRKHQAFGVHTSYTCDICQRPRKTKRGIQLHMQHAHVNTAPRWLCHLCAQPFRGRDGYKKHMGNHVGNNLTECSVCGKWMKEIDLHMDRVHGETKVCTVCGKECVGEKNLTIHMKRVHTEPDASLKCPICAKQMWHLCVFKQHMATHKLKHTTGAGGFPCKYCGITFRSLAARVFHTHSEHLPEREPMRRRRKQKLVLDGSCQCRYCPQTFTQLRSARQHEQRKHRTEWLAAFKRRFLDDDNVAEEVVMKIAE